jgi:hypothetical protein
MSKHSKSFVLPVTSRSWGTIAFAALSFTIYFSLVSSDEQYVVAPVFSALLIGLVFWLTLNERRGETPLADLGAVTVLALVCYTIMPPLHFIISGMTHSINSAYQFYILTPTAEEFSELSWWYVIYLATFVIGYLVTDSNTSETNSNIIAKHLNVISVNRSIIRIFVILLIAISLSLFAFEMLLDMNVSGTYDISVMYDSQAKLQNAPLLFRQLYSIMGPGGLLSIVKYGLIIVIFVNWRKSAYRYALYIWLLLLIARSILWTGARTELVLSSVLCAVMYHHFIKPLRLTFIIPAGFVLLLLFGALGILRGGANLQENIKKFEGDTNFMEQVVAGSSGEFEVLFAGTYDLLQMKKKGILNDVPLQFAFFEIIMIIPQQLLPFEKIDVQSWVISQSANPGYFMYNPIAQSIMGYGWVELVFRGLLLGFVFAKIRIWYMRNASKYWPTLYYFYLITISYYMIRSTAIYVLIVITLFRFIPLYLFCQILSYRNFVPVKRDMVSTKYVSG